MSTSFIQLLGLFPAVVLSFIVLYLMALVIATIVTLKSRYYSPIDKLIRIVLALNAPFLGIILVFYEQHYGKL
ncbi:hypothetical protein AQBE111736_12255 [Aquirufa beregesia]|uniref:hypothetical protein n=1 Tax=Aquirufa beregesia TaxID=2516556 RepID=UPI0039EFE3E1